MTGVLAAIATVLMFLHFQLPFMPSFISLDFSELPALIAAFTLGPVSGVAVCFVKNLVLLSQTITGGVGELSNFIIGSAFVVPAGLIYRARKTRRGALFACILASAVMALCSVPVNYFITYPIYSRFMPIEQIVAAYDAIFPTGRGLLGCLIIFNMPFTFAKGLLCSALTFLVYKRLSGLIKG